MSPRPYSTLLAAVVTFVVGVFVTANAFATRASLHRERAVRTPAVAPMRHRSVARAGAHVASLDAAAWIAGAAAPAAPVDTVPRPAAAGARVAVSRTRVMEEPLRVLAAPREFQIVTVPVPASLPADSAVRYEIRPTGTATILGPLGGVV